MVLIFYVLFLSNLVLLMRDDLNYYSHICPGVYMCENDNGTNRKLFYNYQLWKTIHFTGNAILYCTN